MLLAIDVGNSHIVIGLMEGQDVRYSMRCATDRTRTADEYAFLLLDFCRLHQVERSRVTAAILSSVVPKLKRVLSEAVQTCFHLELTTIGPGLKNGLDIRIENPAELGSDLVVDAVAALSLYKAPLIVIDMGTATTLSYIDADKRYCGGMIIPGLGISMDALASQTSQLRRVELKAPASIIGRNTIHCIQSGAIYGCAAMLDGLIERILAERGGEASVVATGGLAADIVPHCLHAIHYEPNLMLLGLARIHEMNREK